MLWCGIQRVKHKSLLKNEKNEMKTMKKNLVLAIGLCTVALFTSCKSRESAYRQAWEQAMAQDKNQNEQEVTTDNNKEQETVVTPVTPVQPTTTTVTTDHSDVREIDGNMSVVSGCALKTYSVVVGSFVTRANAEGLKTRLEQQGYDARVIQTDEQIKGITPWFRVIASSYDDKASAVQSRKALSSKFAGAWLLFRK